jgi:serine/threonine protein kinase
MAPEIRNDFFAPHDFKVDIWALGVVLYELWEHDLPFLATGPENFMKEIKFSSNVESDCSGLIKKLLQKVPEERIQLADVFLHKWMKDHQKVQRENWLRPLKQALQINSEKQHHERPEALH